MSSIETTMYLLDRDQYTSVFRGDHPEWTQGFARGTEAYVNRYPTRVWDRTVKQEERTKWAFEHIQEITERTTAHELTHLALDRWQLRRWIDEGIAEYIESLIAPSDVASRQLLQRRFLIRDAANRGVAPTKFQLAVNNWSSIVDNEEELGRLYDVSALVVQRVAATSGDGGLRRLIETGSLDIPLGMFLENDLEPWLQMPIAEEVAARVLCGLDKVIDVKRKITADWNAILGAGKIPEYAEYGDFKVRLQQLIDSLNSLPADTIVEETRLIYVNSYSELIATIDDYLGSLYEEGNSHLDRSNALGRDGFRLLSSGWESYVVVSCELIESSFSSFKATTTPTPLPTATPAPPAPTADPR